MAEPTDSDPKIEASDSLPTIKAKISRITWTWIARCTGLLILAGMIGGGIWAALDSTFLRKGTSEATAGAVKLVADHQVVDFAFHTQAAAIMTTNTEHLRILDGQLKEIIQQQRDNAERIDRQQQATSDKLDRLLLGQGELRGRIEAMRRQR